MQEIEEYIKKLNEDLNKLGRNQYNDNKDLEYEGIKEIEIIEENYYKPIETKHAFDDDYIEYESRGDKDNNLSLIHYLNIINRHDK